MVITFRNLQCYNIGLLHFTAAVEYSTSLNVFVAVLYVPVFTWEYFVKVMVAVYIVCILTAYHTVWWNFQLLSTSVEYQEFFVEQNGTCCHFNFCVTGILFQSWNPSWARSPKRQSLGTNCEHVFTGCIKCLLPTISIKAQKGAPALLSTMENSPMDFVLPWSVNRFWI